MAVETIAWVDGRIRIIDQTKLPGEVVYLDIGRVEDLVEAIQNLRIRGAPALGIAGAMGVVLAAHGHRKAEGKELVARVEEAISYLRETRPTAVNLFWALDRMVRVLNAAAEASAEEIREQLLQEALTILEEDGEVCRRMGKNGATLLPDEARVLTHCNAGGLATAGYGTALGVIYAAAEMGKHVRVYVDETRPLFQGSRLTAWELMASGVEATVVCDGAGGFLMRQGWVDCVLVGADRVAANGDVANKIGTYTLAVLAKRHAVPFYVVAPVSSFDLSLSSGEAIPIEERSGEEVVGGFGVRTAPPGVAVYNPAFDITPHDLVSAFVTEEGVLYPPYKKTLTKL